MRFRLRTLLIAVSLAAVVLAVGRTDVAWGLFAYAVSLSLFVMGFRIQAVGRQYDETAPVILTPNTVAKILLANVGLAILGIIFFYISWIVTLLLLMCGWVSAGRPLLVPQTHVGDFWDYLFFLLLITMPTGLGTAATLAWYWLTWPRDRKEPPCPTTSSARG